MLKMICKTWVRSDRRLVEDSVGLVALGVLLGGALHLPGLL